MADNDDDNGTTTGLAGEEFVALMPLEEEDVDDDGDVDEEEEENGDDQQQTAVPGPGESNTNAPLILPSFDNRRDLPPWMDSYVDYRRVNHLVALHNEIVSFCRLMEPRPEEMKQRQDLVDRFTALAKSTFSNEEDCQVDVFGSQATGLCLPTSDIDIAIQIKEVGSKKKKQRKKKKKTNNGDVTENNKQDEEENENETDDSDSKRVSRQQELDDLENWDQPSGSPLQRLATALREEWLDDLSYLEVIENTRVPLVKFTHAPTKISIDVCFNQKTGPQAAALMHQYMEALPPLRPLTFVLKKFMASRGLNQPYTGGVGSFLLQLMIITFLQQRERDSLNNRRASLYNLGALLVEFFEFYSTDFNFITTGISVRYDGFFFPKGSADRKKNYWQPQRPFSIAMENPLDPTYDVGTPSFRIGLVQRAFEVAFKTLLCYVSDPIIPAVSILATILPAASFDEMWDRSKTRRGMAQSTVQTTNNHNTNINNDNTANGGHPVSTHEPPRKRQRR
jgi:non-canonical poly(A) RNA polymerase PAPD5/7